MLTAITGGVFTCSLARTGELPSRKAVSGKSTSGVNQDHHEQEQLEDLKNPSPARHSRPGTAPQANRCREPCQYPERLSRPKSFSGNPSSEFHIVIRPESRPWNTGAPRSGSGRKGADSYCELQSALEGTQDCEVPHAGTWLESQPEYGRHRLIGYGRPSVRRSRDSQSPAEGKQIMTDSQDVVKCPLCEGHGEIRRAKLVERL